MVELATDSPPAPPELIARAQAAVKDFPGCFWFRRQGASVETVNDVLVIILHLREYGGWKAW